jgi:TonB family protein
VAAAAAPRLTGGAIASVILHGGLIAGFIVLRAGTPPPSPPMYRVQLFAAPPGERAPGVVQPAPVLPPVAETPPAPTKTTTPRPKVPSIKPKAPPPQKVATATAPPKAAETKPKTPEPTAGAGEASGKGADVSNIDTNGLEFPYPWYTTRVVSMILQQFRTNSRFVAEVRFVIQRDGTVDPTSIKIVTSSGNYPFDTQALGAIESASRNKGFGALPPGFREDILPVTFRFSPSK